MARTTVELKNYLPDIQGKINSAALEWLEEAAGEIESQVKRNTRTDYGQLKNSWTHQVDRSMGEAVVGSPLENAVWEEYGTGEFAAGGNGRSKPWYVPAESVTGTKKPSYNGKVIVVYGKGGRAYYKTNGKVPQKMFQTALDDTIPKAKDALVEKLKKVKRKAKRELKKKTKK